METLLYPKEQTEVVQSRYMAHWRMLKLVCEYLHGFDNTILYTGSYAIVGTMVIRISYIYTTEEQYEMTNRITKELTKLKKN